MPWQEHVNQQKVGGQVTVDRERIQAFADGIADTSTRHTDPSHPDYAAPPLVVATSIIPGTGSMLLEVDAGNMARIVHGGIDIHFKKPVREGDELACTATFRGVEDKGSGSLVIFDFEVKNAKGESVSDGQTRYFVRGTSKKKGGGKAEAPEEAEPTHVIKEVVPEKQSIRYAKGSGDTFPIHTDPEFAKNVGLPDVILHGMCTLAYSTRAIIDTAAEGDASKLGSLSVRFSKMVFHGDELETRIWVDGSDVRFKTVNQKGQTVLDDGKARIAA